MTDVAVSKLETKTPAVDPVTRELNYTSVSALNKYNHDEYGGCETRWWFKYVMKYVELQTKAQLVGIEGHKQVEHYLPTGEDVLGPIAAAGKYLLPQPGKDLLVEWGMNDRLRPPDVEIEIPAMFDGAGKIITPATKELKQVNFYPLEQSLLRADGLPMLGFMDWINPRGWYVNPDGIWTQDPPNTIEVGDNKFISNVSYAKKPEELAESTQMLGYAQFLLLRNPLLEHVRASHNSFQTRNSRTGVKTTTLLSVATVTKGWEKQGHAVVRRMRKTARITREEDVPANLNSCNAFKTECSFRNNCSKFKNQKPIDRLRMLKFPPVTGVPTMASLADKVRSIGSNVNGAAAGAAAGNTPWIPSAPPPAATAAVAASPVQLTAKSATSGQAYRFVNGGSIGQFLSAVPHGEQLAYSFLPVGADGQAGGTPFLVAADEPVIHIVAAPPAVVAAPPAPPPEVRTRRLPIQDVETVPVVEREPDAPPAPAPLAAQAAASAPKRGKKAAAAAAEDKHGLRLYFGCRPSTECEPLEAYITGVLGALQELHKVDDIRFATTSDHVLAFARWEGALAAAVRASPPPAGDYVAFRGSKITDVVVEALAPLCMQVVRAF